MNPQQPPGYPPLPPQSPPPHRKAPSERRWLIPVLAAAGALIAGVVIGVAAEHGHGPERTVTEYGGLVTAGPTTTVTATPSVQPSPAEAGPGTTMGADGTSGIYVVGVDIKAGTWHTSGATDGDCYVALLSSTSSNDIIDNDNVTGPDTITVGASVKAVQVNGCETWHRTGA